MKKTITNSSYVKKIVFASLLIFSSLVGFTQTTQEASVEKSVFGVQIGVLSIWAHNELKLLDQVALRSEIAVSGPNTSSIAPLLALEPRWYYNLNKRVDKGKRIDGNSGNYVSLRASYHFYNTSQIEENNLSRTLLVPTWGIRRNIGNHFNYEAGGGIGLGFDYDNGRKIGFTSYINLKIGYRF